MKILHTLAACVLFAASVATPAHVVLEQTRAPAASSYRAVFRVGHGCDGLPTRGISVTLPDGVQGAKPMPKPRWALSVRTEKLATPYASHGKQIDADVREIAWTATNKDAFLPDAWYDEFVLRATLPAEPGELAFAVRQVCTRGEWNWAELPTAANPKPRAPAVRLKVVPARAEMHAH